MAGYPQVWYKTPQITTGDWTTVNDSTQQNFPLGGFHETVDSSGRIQIIQYVQFNPTVVATVTIGTAVYYKDATRTVVTNTVTEAASHASSSFGANGSFAGILCAAVATDTYYIWILKNGYFASVTAPVSIVAGDIMVCSNIANTAPTNNVFDRVAAGTAPVAGATLGGHIRALGTVSGGLAAGWVSTEF